MNVKKHISKLAAAAALVLCLSCAALASDTWDGTVGSVPAASDGVITITTGAQLAGFAQSVNNGTTYAGYTIRLGGDIDLNDISWTPVGRFFSYGNTGNRAFSGIFDGAGYSVTGLNVNIANARAGQTAGLFGYIDFPAAAARAASAARNVTAEDKAKADASELGLSGEAYERAVAERKDFYETFGIAPETPQTRSVTPAPTGGIVKNLKVYGSVTNTGGQGAAGVVCWNDGLVENCYFEGTLECSPSNNRSYVGGICSLLGANTYAVNCAAKVDAKAYGSSFSYAGGIAGYCYAMNTGYIVNCSVEPGSVIDSYMDAGGIVGGFAYQVYNCVSAADSILLSGEIPNETGTTYRGGIVGAFGASNNCYWLRTSGNTAQPLVAVGGTVSGGGDVEEGEIEDGSDTNGRCSSLALLPAGTVHFAPTGVTVGASASVASVSYPTGAAAAAPTFGGWSTDNSAVATASNGSVTGVSAGSTAVSAAADSSKWDEVSGVSVTPEGRVTVTQ